jgi:acyl-CoA thioesterase
MRRPATLACHFLGVAAFENVDIEVTTLRATRRTESVRVSMRQGDEPVAEAIVWCVARDLDGPALTSADMPEVAPPHECPRIEELADEDARPPYSFWSNFEYRPLSWLSPDERANRAPGDPAFQAWYRYIPTPVFEDPFVEAARVAMLIDIAGWPSIRHAMDAEDEAQWMAPSLDLSVTFHQPPDESEYLFLDGFGSIAAGGLAGGGGTVWSQDGRLLGSGSQQLIFRPLPAT